MDASFEPLTPVSFLRRSGRVFPDRLAAIDGDKRFTYGELWDRARRLAGALRSLGASDGDRISVLASNSHLLLEAHTGVPLAGCVLNALNVRLTPADLAWIVEHAGARILVYDEPMEASARKVQELSPGLRAIGPREYEDLLAAAEPFESRVADERGLLAINYTSGTTAKPKGVMYHHRGAYLQALAMAQHLGLRSDSTYLWTLPMFHCNGWCFPWAVTAAGATHLCLRGFDAGRVWKLMRDEGVTHFCAAPTVLTMLFWHPDAGPLPHPIRVGTGGAAPTPALLARAQELGMEVTHLYGLTETYGPAVLCEWRPEWSSLSIPEQAQIKSRQGVGNVKTMGEIAVRGNNVMLGYYRDPEATRAATAAGWFRTGDLGVLHPDGYVELKDRAKDVIISGGENISTLEVESAIASHPAVLEVAVVAGPDEKWGEVPVAFVVLKPGKDATEAAITAHAREKLAHFKAPKRVIFGDLPKNATGKIQKFVLRERAKERR
jgi:fatty-acyl-CoA synthase